MATQYRCAECHRLLVAPDRLPKACAACGSPAITEEIKAILPLWLIVLCLVVFFGWLAYVNYHYLPQTPEVVKLQQDADKGDATAKQTLAEMTTEKAAEFAALCHLITVCKTYSSVRQDCATAGSFDTCVAVKMGDADKDLTGSCTSDGNLLNPPDRVPGSIECWIDPWLGR